MRALSSEVIHPLVLSIWFEQDGLLELKMPARHAVEGLRGCGVPEEVISEELPFQENTFKSVG